MKLLEYNSKGWGCIPPDPLRLAPRLARATLFLCILGKYTMSFEDLAATFGLSADKLRRPYDDRLLPLLADFIHPWRLVFESLLSQIDLDDIKKESDTEEERRTAALRKWKERNGSEATYEVLIRLLLSRGKTNQAESICQLIACQSNQCEGG